MAIFDYFKGAALAKVGGDLSNEYREICDEVIKKFIMALELIIQTKHIPLRTVEILSLNGMFVAKTSKKYYFVMYNNKTSNQDHIQYCDLLKFGEVPLNEIILTVQQNLGDVHWHMHAIIEKPDLITVENLVPLAQEYFSKVEKSKKQNKEIGAKLLYPADIRDKVVDFKNWHKEKKTAFIIMPFDNDNAHTEIVKVIKETLQKYDIV